MKTKTILFFSGIILIGVILLVSAALPPPECEEDEDNDKVCDDRDLCENTTGTLVNGDGCDEFQFCEQFYCEMNCFYADFIPAWENNLSVYSQPENVKYPHDCTVVIIAKEGNYFPRCVPTTCIN